MTKTIIVFCLLIVLLPTTLLAQPKLYHVTKDNGDMYILGGTEVPDTSWFDTRIQQALIASSTLWLEVPPEDSEKGVPALRDEVVPVDGKKLHPVAVEAGYGNLALGDYFDVAMGERSVVESQRLNLEGINFRAMKPWLAYYT
ncbi:MAG: hypothetical protein V4628_10620, partial [Pseudomonadota bacterium]